MGLQPSASASWRMLTPSRPSLAKRCWATSQSRIRNASTSAADRFLGMPRSGVRREGPRKVAHELEEAREMPVGGHEHLRPEANGIEDRRVLGDEPLHEAAQSVELGRGARAAGARVAYAIDVEA